MTRLLSPNSVARFLLLYAILALVFLVLQIPSNICKAEDPTLYSCYDSADYTSGSIFETNIHKVFASLYLNTPFTRFNTTAYGQNPDRVYGLVQCGGDATQDDCRNCVNTSITEIVRLCRLRKEGVIRYGGDCVMRYADWKFFGQIDNGRPKVFLHPDQNVSDVAWFKEEVGDLMDTLSTATAASPSKFGTGWTRSANDIQSVYGRLQCTSDLSDSNCYLCLRTIIADIPSCCNGWSGGSVLTVSCNLRFDLFYLLSPPPASPTPAANNGHRTTTIDTKRRQKRNGKLKFIVAVSISLITFAIVVIWNGWFACRRDSVRCSALQDGREIDIALSTWMKDDEEGEALDFRTLEVATESFSNSNKIGQGGCATVYKGKLRNGDEIAVKRLLKSNRSKEIKTEILMLYRRCQHKNIVRFLGYVLEDEQEMLLVYEYLPNLSLDKHLFDPEKCRLLDWERRHKIIIGIAEGLLYLHQDCQPTIIHRDMKASNVLLDRDMNPKIADFGLAKLLFGDQTHDHTRHFAGTYGYVAPEYATQGLFSIKSDVYAFGVLVFEIVTGQQILKFEDPIHNDNLLSSMQRHSTNGTAIELLDRTVRQPFPTNEVSRCIEVGLLCVQENPTDRPTMLDVVQMLTAENSSLPEPSHPATTESQAHTQNDVPSSSELRLP